MTATDFDALETPLRKRVRGNANLARLLADQCPDEPWFIEPKDKLAQDEDARQAEFLRLLPYVAPSLLVWAVPNAGRRTRWEAAKRKREGMRKGALDLTITWNHGSAYAEFKDGRDMPTEDQRDVLNRLYRQGHRCGVFRTAECLFAHLHEWGAPVCLRTLKGLR
jgi:hypothetical protein